MEIVLLSTGSGDISNLTLLLTIIVPIVGLTIFISKMNFNLTLVKKETDKIPGIETRLTVVETKVSSLDNTLNVLAPRIDALFDRGSLNKVSESKSPRKLNDYGKKVLENSGIKNIISESYDDILQRVKDSNPSNAYRAEIEIIASVNVLKENNKILSKIENGAFNSGETVDIVLVVGALNIRDKILSELDLNPQDIDAGDE